MQIVVIGGAGVLGQALLRAIVARGVMTRGDASLVPVQRVISVDRHQPARLLVEPRIEYVRADLGNPRLLTAVMGTVTDSVFHAWDASDEAGDEGAGEPLAPTFALIDSLRDLLSSCAAQNAQPKIMLASAYAALGRRAPQRVGGVLPPHGVGLRLRIAELLLAGAARNGRIDARALRLAPIAAAPGLAQFIGPLLRALSQGSAADCPVPPETALSLTTAEAAAQALVHAHELPRQTWLDVDALDAPACHVTLDALLAAGSHDTGLPPGPLRFQADPMLIEAWARQPVAEQLAPALHLGFAPALDAAALVRQLR